MSELIEEAIERLRALPDERRDGMAALVLQLLQDNPGLSSAELAALDAQLAAPRDDAKDADIAEILARLI